MRVTLLFPYVPASVQSLLNVLAMLTWRPWPLLRLAGRLRGSRRPDVRQAVQYAAVGSALDAADDLFAGMALFAVGAVSWRCIPSPCSFAIARCSTASTARNPWRRRLPPRSVMPKRAKPWTGRAGDGHRLRHGGLPHPARGHDARPHIATVMFGVGFIGAALYLGWPGANAMIVVYLGSMDEAVLPAAAVHPAR